MKLIDDYRRLFLDDVPLLDVRAPVEFDRGAFPNAVNKPLLNDEERESVGIVYKEQGNERATEHGHELITGAIKADRVSAWHAFADMYPDGALYCYRGGQRSEIAQEWLYEDGVDYPRVKGGYKALRRFLMETTDRLAGQFEYLLLGGRTGVGKTELLVQNEPYLDLEGLANHRGSGFGRRVSPQPGQVDFENALSVDLLKAEDRGVKRLLVEDESRCIGARNIPDVLWDQLEQAPVVVLEDSLESRIQRTRRDYVDQQCAEFIEHQGDSGFEAFADQLRDSLQRISRRLGGARTQEIAALMDRALTVQADGGTTDAHESWIERLLVEYYDPMYDYQIKEKGERVRFVGPLSEVQAFLAEQR